MNNARLHIIYLCLSIFLTACATSKEPVNKTSMQRVLPSEKLARAFIKQAKKAEKQKKNPEAIVRKLERRHALHKTNMAFKKSFDPDRLFAYKRKVKMRAIYSSYH